jgi:ADP-ribose pyrophosphatase
MTEAAQQAKACSMEDAKVTETEVIVPGPKRFLREHLVMPDGYECDWYYIDTPPSVMVVPVTSDGLIVMVRQYRHNLKRHVLELPAGTVSDGESTEDAARRELTEETGYVVPDGQLSPLTVLHSLPSETTKWTHIYRAAMVTEGGLPTGDTEIERYFDMSVVLVPAGDAVAMLGREITSADTISALVIACR